MLCKTCQYRLWNLTARRCPECGTPFRPSEFEFAPGSVQFCCPHCDQAYYGLGERGHLVPRAFTRTRCGRPIDMDDTVLRPAEGLDESQTQVTRVPWLEVESLGFARRYLRTVGLALVSPLKLGLALRPDSPAGMAWGFASVNVVAASAVAMAPLVLLPALMGGGGASMCFGGAVSVLIFALGGLVALAVWGLMTHALLRLGPRPAGGLGRTYQALCYSSGANVVSAAPCLGLYIGWLWWVISAIMTVKEAQRVGTGRAIVAVAAPPVLAVTALVAFIVGVNIWAVRTAAGTFGGGIAQTQFILPQLLSARQTGAWPRHAAQLVASGRLSARFFAEDWASGRARSMPVADVTLDALDSLDPPQALDVAGSAADALPPGTVAHRLGDFVFTYHGVDPGADGGLWVVVHWPAPEVPGPAPMGGAVAVGCADGTSLTIPAAGFPAALDAQNRLRERFGLAPLPHPEKVTHASPAVASQPSGEPETSE